MDTSERRAVIAADRLGQSVPFKEPFKIVAYRLSARIAQGTQF